MTELKPGDRIHIEGDGTVVDVVVDGYVAYRIDSRAVLHAPADWCTKIVPPVQVGDTVTAENIAQLEHEGTCVWQPFRAKPRWYDGRIWCDSTGDACHETDVYGCTVLRIGSAS